MAQSTTTVTPDGPTPPTNLGASAAAFYGARPPLPSGLAATDDGWQAQPPIADGAGASPLVFQAVLAGAGPPASVAAEGAGTENSYTSPGGAISVGCLGAYTTHPNQDHASSLTPATNPTLTSIAPTTSVHGSAAVTMTATGTGFTRASKIYIGGVAQPTTFVSATSLTCSATPPATATPPTIPVTVVSGGIGTAAQTWTIT